MHYDTNHPESPRLSSADAELIDRLLAGESLSDVVDANQPHRAEHVNRLLSLLAHWEAPDAEPGLAQRTMTGILSKTPTTLCQADGEALDALLELRQKGLADGPMPAGLRERAAGVERVLSLLDHAQQDAVPTGLAQRTMQAIEEDRASLRQRSVLASINTATDRQSPIGIRQIATTAALLLMAMSILLPMLSNAQRDAKIAQCSQNLAGLGNDLQQIAFDQKGATHRPAQPNADVYNPLAKFARTRLDGSAMPANHANVFVLIDEQRVSSAHMACPTGSIKDPAALYNGQNPAAGGPFRLFFKPRPIFADTNPLYRVTPRGLVRDTNVPSMTRSANHAGIGQNVLISDGSVRWMIRPAVQTHGDQSDNIWLYQPGQQAGQDDDIFLTP